MFGPLLEDLNDVLVLFLMIVISYLDKSKLRKKWLT